MALRIREYTPTESETDFRTNEQLRADIDSGLKRADDFKAAQLEDPYGQMREIVERRELDGLRNTQRADAAVAAAMKIAQERKGVLPPEAVGFLNRQFGFDGKDTGIVEGGFDKDGNFGFVFAERGKDGGTSHRMQMIPLAQQLGVMEGNLQLFGQDAVDGLKDRLLKGGMSSAELDAMSSAARGRRERMAQRIEELRPKNTQLEVAKLNAATAAQKNAYDLQKADVAERGRNNRALMANLAQLLRNKQVYEGLYRGDPLYDEDGKPLMEYDKNGNEVQRYGRANDDVVSQRMMDLANRLAAASGGGTGGGTGGGWVSGGLPSSMDLVGGNAGGGVANRMERQQANAAPQPAQAERPEQAAQPASAQRQSEQQQSPQMDERSRAEAVAEAKARRAAILEERERRERERERREFERGGLPKGALPNDKLPDSITGGPVGPTLENERRAQNADADAENAAKERERSYIEHINSFGGRVDRDQYGNQVVHISKYEYLPDDLKSKYPDGVLTGVPLDVADDIQRQAEMGFREHAKAEGAKRDAAKAEVDAAAKKLKSELLKRFPTDSEARDREFQRGLHAIRMEKDERYRRNYEYQKKREREEAEQQFLRPTVF